MLERDRVDIILYSRWNGRYIIRKRNLTGIQILEPALAKREMYMYLNKKHLSLVGPLNEELKKLKSTGEYDRLFEEKVVNYTRQ